MHRRSFLKGIAAGGLSLPAVGAAETPASYRQSSFEGSVAAPKVNLVIDTFRTLGPIDLSRYALGQGGLSDQPMIDDRIEQIRQLHPQTIHVFLQEYFNLYPAHHKYHWDTLDKTMEAIRATGASPVVSLCIKPRVLYPQVNDEITDPTDYAEWEELVYQVVKHCNQDRKYGIEYWILTNEADIGEPGGVPFKFLTPESYLRYYQHTASAIHRADPKAKVGGPSTANPASPQNDVLIAAAGQGKVPLEFLSFHLYSNDPQEFRRLIDSMHAKLAQYPSLSKLPTFIDQWNMSLFNPILNPYFQPSLILETTLAFYRAGLSGAAYYHIRDYFVDQALFSCFLSPRGDANMAHWWNTMPQYDGLYDNQDRLRPAYYAFVLLNHIKGQKLQVIGTDRDINAVAAREDPWTNVVLWNFPLGGAGRPSDVTVKFPSEQKGSLRLVKLNPESPVNNLEQIRNGAISDSENNPVNITLRPYDIYWIEITRP
jgi:xylan 1,4-beta-xylosidase